MSIFNSIKDKLFGKKEPAKPVTPPKPAASTVPQGIPGMPAAAQAALAAQQAAASKPPVVDIEAILEAAVKAKGQKLNWRTSIVDFMKALDLDSSLNARKQLAVELNYRGTDPDGSAEKNIWLHKELMKALADNGGKLPAAMLK